MKNYISLYDLYLEMCDLREELKKKDDLINTLNSVIKILVSQNQARN
jgi:hypothetical protein